MENKHKNTLDDLKKGLSDDASAVLEKVCKELSAKYVG
jgi:hypothetical protein